MGMIEGDYTTYTWGELVTALRERDERIKAELRTISELTQTRTQLIRERDIQKRAKELAEKSHDSTKALLRSTSERHSSELSAARKHQEIKLKEQGAQLGYLNEVVRGLRESLADFRSGAAYQLQVQKLRNKNKLFTQVLEQLEAAEKAVADRDRQLQGQNRTLEIRSRSLASADETIKRLDDDLKLHMHELREVNKDLTRMHGLRAAGLETIEDLNRRISEDKLVPMGDYFAAGDQVEYRSSASYPWKRGELVLIDDQGTARIKNADSGLIDFLHQRIRKYAEPKVVTVRLDDIEFSGVSADVLEKVKKTLRENSNGQ